jgi:CRISPR-associated RAMP protein (TIGR02581 family)
MHKRLWNTLKLEFEVEPRAPLLIKSGVTSPNPALPDMQFVRTRTPDGEKVYIPGSSLKGTFRSFTEKVLRTVNSDWACDPFTDHACGPRLKDNENTAEIYRRSCKACKTYGNTRLRGRLSFTDALPKGAVITETRYGVAISRLTNAVAVGPFDIEVLVQGTFTGALVLQNFEVWQFGLLVLTLEAINDGIVKLGYGKNRGFGEVAVQPTRMTFELAKHSQLPKREIWGVGAFVSDDERKSYGFVAEDKLRDLPETKDEQDLALYVRRVYGPEQWNAIARKSVESLTLLGANK